MATSSGIHNQSGSSAHIHPFHTAGKSQQLQEASIEARIQRLGDEIESLNSDSRLVWLSSGPHVYNRDFDLTVKVEAIRWMLRIAGHMEESAREVMLLRVENSLRQLERTLESAEWSSAT